MRCLCFVWVCVVAPSLFGVCAPLASPCAAFKAADFVGIVRLDAAWHPTAHSTESLGVVLKSYKGALEPGMAIDFYGAGVCYDAPYQVGAVHVVYASRLPDGRYSTDCTRTHLLGESQRDMEFLERFSSRLWLAALVEPFGCNERRLPALVHRIWIWSLTL